MKKLIEGYTPTSQVRSGQESNKKLNYLTPFLSMTVFQNSGKNQNPGGVGQVMKTRTKGPIQTYQFRLGLGKKAEK